MKDLKVSYEITCQFAESHLLSEEKLENMRKRYISQLFVKKICEEGLFEIKSSKVPSKQTDTYEAQFFVQTTEEYNEMINALRHLEGTIMGLTSANTQETLLQQLDKLKEILK